MIGKAIYFVVFPTVGSMNILTILMRKSDAVNWRRAGNTMTTRKTTKGQTMIYKTLHRKINKWSTRTSLNLILKLLCIFRNTFVTYRNILYIFVLLKLFNHDFSPVYLLQTESFKIVIASIKLRTYFLFTSEKEPLANVDITQINLVSKHGAILLYYVKTMKNCNAVCLRGGYCKFVHCQKLPSYRSMIGLMCVLLHLSADMCHPSCLTLLYWIRAYSFKRNWWQNRINRSKSH